MTLELAKTVRAPSSRREIADRICIRTEHRVGKGPPGSAPGCSDVIL